MCLVYATHARILYTWLCVLVCFSVQSCTEDSSAAYQAQDVQKQNAKAVVILLALLNFSR